MIISRVEKFLDKSTLQITRKMQNKNGINYTQTITKHYYPNSNIVEKLENLLDYVKQGVAKKVTSTFSSQGKITERIEMGGGKNSNYKIIRKYNESGTLISNKESFCDIGCDFDLD